MLFGRDDTPPEKEKAPTEWRWNGSRETAFSLWEHARDAAGLMFFQVPNRYKDFDSDSYLPPRLLVPCADGQGVEWVIIPRGATVYKEGTAEEPVFRIVTAREKAAALGG